jgi:hypothetical protein
LIFYDCKVSEVLTSSLRTQWQDERGLNFNPVRYVHDDQERKRFEVWLDTIPLVNVDGNLVKTATDAEELLPEHARNDTPQLAIRYQVAALLCRTLDEAFTPEDDHDDIHVMHLAAVGHRIFTISDQAVLSLARNLGIVPQSA